MAAITAIAGKIVTTVTSPVVTRSRERQSMGTMTTETAAYATAIRKSGTALKSRVFVSMDMGGRPVMIGMGPVCVESWDEPYTSFPLQGFWLEKMGRAAYSQRSDHSLAFRSLGDANRGARTWP